MKTQTSLVILVILAGFVGGSISSFLLFKILDSDKEINNEERIAEFYAAETAVYVSPHSLRKSMLKGEDNFILVDVRSEEEYLNEHIVGATSIPAYKDKDNSDYGAVDRIVGSFRDLKEKYPQKEIITYCYSIPCMTSRKVGNMLAKEGIYVKELGIGWNEWRYSWNSWNHEHEWNKTNVKDYISSGPEPGELSKDLLNSSKGVCPISGALGC